MRAKELLTTRKHITEDPDYDPKQMVRLDPSTGIPRKKQFEAAGEKIIPFLHENCEDWLQESKNGQLAFFRGHLRLEKDDNLIAFTKRVRENRTPRDSSFSAHTMFNQIIDLCGGSANRNNAIFVSSDRDSSDHYGTSYIAIPIGPFEYTWHADYGDWTSEMHAIISNVLVPASEIKLPSDQQEYIKTVAHDHYMADPSKPYESYVDKLTKQAQEQKRNQLDRTYGDLEKYIAPERVKNNFCPGLHIDYLLEKAFNRGNEVMIKCNSYIAIQPNFYFSYILDHI